MTASIKILTVASMDSSPALVLVAPDGSKTLINCGEGCQRSFLEHSQRLSTVQTVCLTHISYDSVGGLPGMILTSADAAAASTAAEVVAAAGGGGGTQSKPQEENEGRGLDILGPRGTEHFVRSLRHFMRREKFPVRIKEGETTHHTLQKHKKKTNKKRKKSDDDDAFQYTIQSVSFSAPIDDTRHSGEGSHFNREGETKEPPLQQVLSFAFTTPPIPGKFLPEKAAAIGVPKGPLYGKLKGGQSVTFLDESSGKEKTVESYQVVQPSSPGVAILVLSYPTLATGRQVFACNRFCELVASDDFGVDLVVHIAPDEVFAKLSAERWTHNGESGGPIEHIHLPTGPCTGAQVPTPFHSAALGAKSRNMLCSDIYLTPHEGWSADTIEDSAPGKAAIRLGRPMMEYVFIPRAKRGFYGMSPRNGDTLTEKQASELALQSSASSLAKRLLPDVDLGASDEKASKRAPGGELFFTGTGSALPCKHRNVTGMLLRGSDGRGILLDVGEGTVGQLLRLQNESESGLLESIKAVWISHPHADHHLGILRLLHERKAPDPVLLLAPTPLFRFLEEYSTIDPSLADAYERIDSRDLIHDNPVLKDRIQKSVGVTSCRAVRVTHCAHAYAVILDGTDFGKLVYSGDCRPSGTLADMAKGADLLIHEATFEDGMEAEAALKRHCTVGEALGIARRMEAKRIVLTHFSQRYPRISPTPAEEEDSLPIIFAFDYMRLTPTNLDAASKLTPALRLLYPAEEKEKSDVCENTAEAAMSVPGLFAHSELL